MTGPSLPDGKILYPGQGCHSSGKR